MLKRTGSYAYKKRTNIPDRFKLGEGMVGQAALEKKHILIDDVPGDYIGIHYGVGDLVSRYMIFIPLYYHESVRGVVELGSFRKFTDLQILFLNQISESIAVAFHSLQSSIKTEDLLDKTQQLVELMGGKFDVKSEIGKGSTFSFTAIFPKQTISKTVNAQITEAEITLKGKHILVVDDNKTNRLLMKKLLSSWGCRHTEAPDGKTALKKLTETVAKNPVHIAILDMQMPEMDGAALGRKIKQNPALKDIALVMMTSMGQRGDVARIKKIGFSAYLNKPVKQSQLYDCLVSVFNNKNMNGMLKTDKIVTRHSLAEQKKQKQRILLAEDNVINQLVAVKILKNLGYSTDVVANGLEAVNAVKSLPYDLVLMDVQMPELDGLEATCRIRNLTGKHKNPKIPIVAMTAHAMKGDREKCLKAGMDDYVSKPINPQELVDVLERNLCVLDREHRSSRKK